MLTDAQFRRGVEACGGEVRPWNQDGLVDGRVFMNRGACAQLAAVWIRNTKFRETGQQLPSRNEQFDEVSWMCEQKHYGRDMIDVFFRGNGLRNGLGRIVFTRNFDIDKVAFFILSQPAYYLMGAVADDGHGIAFSTTVIPSLFDANFGEARFHTLHGLDRFLKAYWVRAYPDLNDRGFIDRYR